jgi:hypothetical protein
MKPKAIHALADAVPGLRDLRPLKEDWLGDMIAAPEGTPLAGEIEAKVLDGADSSAGLLDIAQEADGAVRGSVLDSLPGLRDVGSDFPGGLQTARDPEFTPPPDALAFYLPWHHFPDHQWGIYLPLAGIEQLGRCLRDLSGNKITRSESNWTAKIFLFHHEAYHNAVEAFASRLESTHREPCYIAGFRDVFRKSPADCRHEEALADVYAYDKVYVEQVFKGQDASARKQTALKALRDYIGLSPPPYCCAIDIIDGRARWYPSEYALQEASLRASLPRLPAVSPEVWRAFGHAMHPSLARNRRFSYLITKDHATRIALKVHY